MSDEVTEAAERLIHEMGVNWRDIDREDRFFDDILTVARAALASAERVEAAREALAELHVDDWRYSRYLGRVVIQTNREEDTRRILDRLVAALAAPATAAGPAEEKHELGCVCDCTHEYGSHGDTRRCALCWCDTFACSGAYRGEGDSPHTAVGVPEHA